MRSQRRYVLVIVSLFMMIALFSLPDGNAVHELFESMDKNRDGEISQKEFRDNMERDAFEKLDTDNDQVIEEEEWTSLEHVSEWEGNIEFFEGIDKDKDRRINFFEFSDYADRKSNLDEAFMGLDKDGSNSISPDEITTRPLFKMLTIKF